MVAGDLPEDLTSNILSRLPIKSLLHFSCVHKTWNSLLKSSYFITSHFKNPNNKDYGLIFVKYQDPEKPRFRLVTCDTYDIRLDLGLPSKSLRWCFYVGGSCNGLVCLFDVGHLQLQEYEGNPFAESSEGQSARIARSKGKAKKHHYDIFRGSLSSGGRPNSSNFEYSESYASTQRHYYPPDQFNFRSPYGYPPPYGYYPPQMYPSPP
ncbi:putative F-box protein At1g33530 [Durio zibethinus]|uniref:F-box protein At1g33530 n=1 Tax=Durio zibethinus TaxID=66656 RepID=A0A6P5WXE7_DURZI|nr:putative F-box protein At1g33530 [Durio zibethinus]